MLIYVEESSFLFFKKIRVIWLTLPLLCNIVVLVRHTLSRLTMSLVTSTSASTKLLCFWVMSSSRSGLIVERFLAMILALMAAIFSTDMASDRDLRSAEVGLAKLRDSQPQFRTTKQLRVITKAKYTTFSNFDYIQYTAQLWVYKTGITFKKIKNKIIKRSLENPLIITCIEFFTNLFERSFVCIVNSHSHSDKVF